MAKSKTDKKVEVQPLSDYEESLIYMAYRYAIGRHTIHSHSLAGDIMSHEYERFKLSPNRMYFTSKDINRSIEDCLRWGSPSVYFDGNQGQENFFPLECTYKAINLEKEKYPNFDITKIKKINIVLNRLGEFLDYSMTYYKEDEKIPYYSDMNFRDLEIWNNVAKVFDMSTHKWCRLIDDSVVEYVEIIGHDKETLKSPVNKYIHNTVAISYIPEENIKEDNIMYQD